jgi:DNA (cytosine-5)-methyltransferase 1
MLKVLDLFSGLGSFSLGLERAGMRTVGFCEKDEFCRRVLEKQWPGIVCHEDIGTREFSRGEADFIAAGWPCQNISRAGDGTGLAGASSGLFRHVVRAFCLVRPIGGLLENVADLLHRGMGEVVGALAEIGYDTEWDCVPAATVGAPHLRDRVWIAAYSDGQRRLQPGWAFSDIRRRPHDGAPPSPWLHTWQEELSQVQGMDDGPSTRLDSAAVDALGNSLVPQIPEIIGRAILSSLAEAK